MSEKKLKILIVEDEDDIRDLMRLQLEAQNYQVETCNNGTTAHQLLLKWLQRNDQSSTRSEMVDLIILDWMLPSPSGIELCRIIRQELRLTLPILMVTAKADPEFVIQGLDSGADDYLTKPFAMEILLARVRALLRRSYDEADESKISLGGIELNEKKVEATCHGQPVQLTISEFKILLGLMKRPGHVFTRKQLIEQIAGGGVHVGGRTIDTQLVSLRKKLGDLGNMIDTVRGVGYKFKEKV